MLSDVEGTMMYKIENLNKGLEALNQTVNQLKGVSFIGDEKRTKALARNALDIAEAIGQEIDGMRNIDPVDEALSREVNEKLLMLLREASFKLDDK